MNRSYSILLSVYWTVTFAASAWMAAQADGVFVPGPAGGAAGEQLIRLLTQLGLVLGNTLVAILFVWTLFVSLLDPDDRRETAAVAQLACAGAIKVLLAEALHAGLASGWAQTPSAMTTMTFLAVLATHLVLRPGEGAQSDLREIEAPAAVIGPAAAIRITDAAHRSFVARLAETRRFGVPPHANDDRSL
ncbi:hypothetical protein AB2N04_12715 [Nitratireductor sp. GISD-1A_MAKvit]|uniref:hypothetical protein n=1 Tax=Nitratireductor sp. GISD-1A_MAKvit TaxID=3234198 RepID=UPI0034679B01